MSGRPAYPKVVTTSRISGGTRASGVTSPADSVHPPSVAASSDVMSSKKRSTGPSRGNSPPEKRVRSGEYDRPTREKDARRESLDRRVLNGVRMPSDAGQSPLVHNHSPLSGWHGDRGSPGSGASTPQPVAPPAPSMLATASSSSVGTSDTRFDFQALVSVIRLIMAHYNNSQLEQQEKLEESPSGTVSSLRIIKARKRAQASTELENYKQRIGNFMPLIARAANADRNGMEGLSNEERATLSRTQAESKALQIEVDNLKNERKTILSRLAELEKLNTLRQEMDTLSNQITPLKTVPQQLTKLSGLPDSFDRLRATSNELDQWRRNQAKPLTLEQVQRTITECMAPALDAIRTDFTTQIERVLKESSPSSASVQDVRMLVEFKKQIEEANWPNQLRVLKERIEKVSKNEIETHSDVRKLTIELEKLENTQNNALRRLEQKFDDKIERNLDDFESEFKRVNGPLKVEHERTGKTVLDRVQLLETTYSQIKTSQGKHDMLSDDLANAKRDINAKLASLSATATDAKTRKELNDRIDTVSTTVKELREATNAKLASLSATATDAKSRKELDDRIDTVSMTVKELREATNAKLTSLSAIAADVKRTEELNGRIDTVSTTVKQLREATNAKLTSLSAIATDVKRTEELNDRINAINTTVKELREETVASEKKWTGMTSSLEARISSAEQQLSPVNEARAVSDQIIVALRQEVKAAHDNIDEVNNGLTKVEESVHNLTTSVKTLKEDVVHHFKKVVQDEIQRFKEVVQGEIQMLKNRPEPQLQVTTPQSTLTAAERQQLQQIQSLVNSSQALAHSNLKLQTWQSTMDNKANALAQSTAESSQQIAIIQRALHSLEDRYENISTDTLHQQMVHWFTQNYPNAHDIINRLNLVQQDLLALKDFATRSSGLFQYKDPLLRLAQVAQELTDMAQYSQHFVQIVRNNSVLEELVQHSQQLKYIAQNGTVLPELPEIKQKLEETSRIAEKAMRTSDQAVNMANSNTGNIAKLYSTLTALNVDVKLIHEYRAQQTELSNDIKQQRESIYALDAKVDSARNEWTEPINKLAADVKTVDSSLFVQGKRIDNLGQQIDDVKGSVSSFKRALDVDQILEFCAVIPQFILAISQFQQALEDINTNLPGGGLAFKFSLDLNELHERFIKRASISEGRKRV